jgi:hypothetical protein
MFILSVVGQSGKQKTPAKAGVTGEQQLTLSKK